MWTANTRSSRGKMARGGGVVEGLQIGGGTEDWGQADPAVGTVVLVVGDDAEVFFREGSCTFRISKVLVGVRRGERPGGEQ